MSLKEKIGEIENASEKLLVPEHEQHLAKRLFKDLLDKTMTEAEIDEIEKEYLESFKRDEIQEIIYESKKAKGYIKD